MSTTLEEKNTEELAMVPAGSLNHGLVVSGEEAIELVKQTLMPNATNAELAFFVEVCNRMNLDPFRREIHPVKRRVREGDRYVERWVFQTGIDGYRKRAAATGQYAGSEEAFDVPMTENYPNVATCTVYRMVGGQRVPFVASAKWNEYVQTDRQNHPTAMWRKMPFVMLSKCAESRALRKAFPDELNGVYSEEELMHDPERAVALEKEPPKPLLMEPVFENEPGAEGGERREEGETESAAAEHRPPVSEISQEEREALIASIREKMNAVMPPIEEVIMDEIVLNRCGKKLEGETWCDAIIPVATLEWLLSEKGWKRVLKEYSKLEGEEE